MKIKITFLFVAALTQSACFGQQTSSQEPKSLPRRSDCFGEIVHDVETTSRTKLADPADAAKVDRMDRIELQPSIKREEVYVCVRADSTFRMEIRIKVPSDSSLLEFWSPQKMVPTEALSVFDSNRVISYDEYGKSIDTFHSDQSFLNELKYLQMLDLRKAGPEGIHIHLDSVVQRGGIVEYLTSGNAKATYKGILGGTITEFIDLRLGMFTELTIHDTSGELTLRKVFRYIKGVDGKIRPLQIVTESWSTLSWSGVAIVKEETEVYHSYDYHFSD